MFYFPSDLMLNSLNEEKYGFNDDEGYVQVQKALLDYYTDASFLLSFP